MDKAAWFLVQECMVLGQEGKKSRCFVSCLLLGKGLFLSHIGDLNRSLNLSKAFILRIMTVLMSQLTFLRDGLFRPRYDTKTYVGHLTSFKDCLLRIMTARYWSLPL